jgi:hypothetical protein
MVSVCETGLPKNYFSWRSNQFGQVLQEKGRSLSLSIYRQSHGANVDAHFFFLQCIHSFLLSFSWCTGKTYAALERLKQASKGMYLGPLRLLAAEVYEQLTMAGIYCNLYTGQERREIPFATHVRTPLK